jgi:glycosyltransferase involved in cell wall biosynthesis
LQPTGRLRTLYTDFWAGPVFRRLAFGKLRPLAGRYHPELAKATVRSWNLKALGWELLLRRKFSGANASSVRRSPYDGFVEVGRRFATCVRDDLKRQRDLPPGSIFFAYDTGALEALEWCGARGIKCVLNQMDPNRVEVELVRSEEKIWPGWALQPIEVSEAYFERREREWSLADRVVVNSEFSRQALLQQGVPAEKLVVVPLCYEAKVEKKNLESGNESSPSAANFSASSPLRVLFLGQVILRKGIQYLMAAARQLEGEPVHFDVVGAVGISAEAVASAPRNMTFHGRTGRDGATAWYQRSQVFVLPTISDGFALTQLEAMSHGLPVVATPCCGAVVSDGSDGFIVPPRDVTALVKSFQRYLVEPKLLNEQKNAALLKATQFTLQHLATNLRALEQSFPS